jgi:hypothetical protein
MSFEDLAARIETLGGRERVRGHLSVMRDVERDRYVRDKHGEEAVQVTCRLQSNYSFLRIEQLLCSALTRMRTCVGCAGRL